jgi:hypothetical protein
MKMTPLHRARRDISNATLNRLKQHRMRKIWSFEVLEKIGKNGKRRCHMASLEG